MSVPLNVHWVFSVSSSEQPYSETVVDEVVDFQELVFTLVTSSIEYTNRNRTLPGFMQLPSGDTMLLFFVQLRESSHLERKVRHQVLSIARVSPSGVGIRRNLK